MIRPRKYTVYYREMPRSLASLIKKDGNMTVAKDGVYWTLGYPCPRLTITVAPVSVSVDKERLRRLEELLGELAANNQIAGWA